MNFLRDEKRICHKTLKIGSVKDRLSASGPPIRKQSMVYFAASTKHRELGRLYLKYSRRAMLYAILPEHFSQSVANLKITRSAFPTTF